MTGTSSARLAPHHLILGAGVLAARGTRAAARVALTPTRLAAPLVGGLWRSSTLQPLRRVVEEEAAAIALVGMQEEAVIRVKLEPERLVDTLLERPELNRIITAVLANPETERLVQQLLDSHEAKHVVETLANSPEVRTAVALQTASFGDMVGREIRGRGASADDLAERVARGVLKRRPRRSRDPTP
jgi:hypothetical protein